MEWNLRESTTIIVASQRNKDEKSTYKIKILRTIRIIKKIW